MDGRAVERRRDLLLAQPHRGQLPRRGNRQWANYIVPRRTHLYVTHSITNAAYDATKIGTLFTNGVFVSYCAGIPESQPSNLTVTIAERVFPRCAFLRAARQPERDLS